MLGGENVLPPRIVHATEINGHARDELLAQPHCPEHLFGDYEKLWLRQITERIDRLQVERRTISLTDLLPFIRDARSVSMRLIA